MSDDLHARFAGWMARGALGEPSRDAAVHASVCEGCLSLVAARDALAAIDTGRATLPASRLAPRKRSAPLLAIARVGLAIVAVVMLGAALAFGASQLIAGGRGTIARAPSPTLAGGVLGAVGAPSASVGRPSPGPTASPTPSPRQSASRAPALTPSAAETPPAQSPPPLGSLAASASPSGPAPAPPTAPPTAAPTPSRTPRPSPTPSPTPTPTPSPTPTPTPVPACSDGVDNDGDGLIDFGGKPTKTDPECLSPGDNDESVP